ncbi:tRNA adenosine(34) deaminase TadA [Tuanshanicoccus lijuaniae]|uniref:tRNA adenosine(34) deaminase TadA n=1 Tax=Aerococcaceae bacterium zg-1292 TaxID=2774330 RepID=UPI0019390802|nr:tRNA adenosine(34) deaminase TadA [Aerococcaceae bacterium zg-1292]QQA37220.1 tRNA adenosine(34) deaminase TadA [Aerococcaceae bacterium zg-1292]
MHLSESERLRHEKWMRVALAQAALAEKLGEVPIGAVIVKDEKVIAKAYNLRELSHVATAHAELLAINEANQLQEKWRLEGATLYVTLEPCPMCAGAIILSRIQTVVFGARDPKAGCVGSLMNIVEDTRFNHNAQVIEGILAEECGQRLSHFFKALRERRKKEKVMHNSVDNLQ